MARFGHRPIFFSGVRLRMLLTEGISRNSGGTLVNLLLQQGMTETPPRPVEPQGIDAPPIGSGEGYSTVAPETVQPSAAVALGLLAAAVATGFLPVLCMVLLSDPYFRQEWGVTFVEPRTLTDWGFPLAILISSVALFCIVYATSIRPLRGGMRAFGFTTPSWAGLLAMTGLVVALLLGQSGVLSLLPAEWVPPLDSQLRANLPMFGTAAWGVFAIAAIVAAPIAEECVFRGVLFRWLRGSLGFWAGGIVSSMLFATMHLYIVSPGGLVGAVLTTTVFAAGLGFCWLLERYRSLTLCVLGHALYNAILLGIS